MSLPYLVLFAIIGWGVGSLFYKVANDAMHPVMVSSIVTAVYIVMTPLTFLTVKFEKTITWNGTIFAILGAICMGVGSMGYSFALKKGGAGEVTTVCALYPALTMVLSMIFMDEQITWRKGIGIGLALISVFILSFK